MNFWETSSRWEDTATDASDQYQLTMMDEGRSITQESSSFSVFPSTPDGAHSSGASTVPTPPVCTVLRASVFSFPLYPVRPFFPYVRGHAKFNAPHLVFFTRFPAIKCPYINKPPNRILSPGLLQMSAQRVMRSFPSLLPSISTRSPMDVNTTSSSSLPTPSYSTSILTVFMRRQKMVSMVSFLSHQHRTCWATTEPFHFQSGLPLSTSLYMRCIICHVHSSCRH